MKRYIKSSADSELDAIQIAIYYALKAWLKADGFVADWYNSDDIIESVEKYTDKPLEDLYYEQFGEDEAEENYNWVLDDIGDARRKLIKDYNLKTVVFYGNSNSSENANFFYSADVDIVKKYIMDNYFLGYGDDEIAITESNIDDCITVE